MLDWHRPRNGWIIELVDNGEPETNGMGCLMGKIAKTYTIRLCKNGQTFQSIPNVVDDGPRPKAGDVIDGKWKVLGVLISSSATEIFVDVVEV